MIRENKDLNFRGNGRVQTIIDGSNKLDTKEFLSGVITNTVEEKVYEKQAKEVEIRENNENQTRPDFSDLLDL